MHRYFVVANQTAESPELVTLLHACHAVEHSTFHLVVPASRVRAGAVWTEGHALADARVVLDAALEHYRNAELDATGEVGDADPVLAIGDALRTLPCDTIIVSTLPPGLSKWLRRDLPHRITRRYTLPIVHIVSTVPERAATARKG